jgi:hypothetical protein
VANTVAPWPMPERQSLLNLEGAEHSSSHIFQVKMKHDNKKKLFPPLVIVSNFFYRTFANPFMM